MINSVFLLNDARARDEQPNIVRAAKDTRRGIFPFDGRLQPTHKQECWVQRWKTFSDPLCEVKGPIQQCQNTPSQVFVGKRTYLQTV